MAKLVCGIRDCREVVRLPYALCRGKNAGVIEVGLDALRDVPQEDPSALFSVGMPAGKHVGGWAATLEAA